MSKANYELLSNYINILTNGVDNTEMATRPKWQNGKPAHTVGVINEMHKYNLQDEFPIASVRKLYWKSCIDETLWIWQKKSNNVKDLNARIWDQWANKGEHPEQEIGSIGKAYGYQLGLKNIKTKNGYVDQVDAVLNEIKTNPGSRRIITNIYNHSDLHDMNLYPCAYNTTWLVKKGKLNLTLHQRSNDTLSAGAWNVAQYAALLVMFAQVTGLEAGEFCHFIEDSHCYDMHIPREFQVILNHCSIIQKRLYNVTLDKIFKCEDKETIRQFEDVLDELKEHDYMFDFDSEFKDAERVSLDENTNWFEYLDYIRKTPELAIAKTLIQKMIAYPKLDKFLGFETPKLKLDPNVKDFYDFKSPRTYTGSGIKVEDGKLVRDGKYVNNPESSFNLEGYNPESEGFEFSTPVPVAE